jgi:hypothetical protein
MQRSIYNILVSCFSLIQRFISGMFVKIANIFFFLIKINLVLWFISFLDDSSCHHTSIKWFSFYWFKCLYCFYLLYTWFISGIYSIRTNSTFLFSHFIFYCHMYNSYCLFSICSKSKLVNLWKMDEMKKKILDYWSISWSIFEKETTENYGWIAFEAFTTNYINNETFK